ncbi:MAG: hypothetical protein U9N59_00355 [Campylobacterota bacterium]|nr:hypothetical protein [Campylobacterota bacterium]
MKLKILISSILFFSILNANDTLTQINFEQDNDGNFNPNIFVPINWNNDYYSGIGYASSTSKDIKKLNNFEDSKNGAVSTKSDTTINWITKKISNYSIGIQTNIQKINNNEFGYIHDTTNTFGKGDDYWIAFDNDIELDILKTSIYADYSKNLDDIFLRVSTTISPSTKIDVKQSTLFKPLVSDIGSSSSSTSQDLSYSFMLEGYYDTNSFINLGLEYSYDFNPLKYDIAQLSYENSNYLFKTATIDTDETTTKYIAKIYFDKKVLGDLNPSIGFGKISTKIKDNNSNDTTIEDSNIISIGFEKRF